MIMSRYNRIMVYHDLDVTIPTGRIGVTMLPLGGSGAFGTPIAFIAVGDGSAAAGAIPRQTPTYSNVFDNTVSSPPVAAIASFMFGIDLTGLSAFSPGRNLIMMTLQRSADGTVWADNGAGTLIFERAMTLGLKYYGPGLAA
jgi:hypothetical protein